MKKTKPDALPTYQELAELVARLAEVNISNIDRPESRFVTCFTYGADRIPDHWWRAIQIREALIQSNLVERRARNFDRPTIRNRRGKKVTS